MVVDASVAIKWIVEEPGRQEARAILLREERLLAPEFVLVEAANVLALKARSGQITAEDAVAGLATIQAAFLDFVRDATLIDDALRLALELRHPIYDCLYLACAAQANTLFVTADKKLLEKLRNASYSPAVRALES